MPIRLKKEANTSIYVEPLTMLMARMTTGNYETGLLFIAFQKVVTKQFIDIQNNLGSNDKLNEYTYIEVLLHF